MTSRRQRLQGPTSECHLQRPFKGVWIKASRPTQSMDGHALITKETSCPDGKRVLRHILKLGEKKKKQVAQQKPHL